MTTKVCSMTYTLISPQVKSQSLNESSDSRHLDMKDNILWVSGRPTSGKTWIGDFLLHHHDWQHLDGDEQFFLQPHGDAVQMYNHAREDYQFKDKPAPAQLWMPFLSNICEQAMEMRKNISTNMVITMGLFSREQADFVRQRMKSVTFVDLQISDEDFLARNKTRNRRKADVMGLSMKELWDGRERMKKFGEFSEEKEMEYYRRGDGGVGELGRS